MNCPACRQEVQPGALHGPALCVPQPPGADTEQAFWDACVAAMFQRVFEAVTPNYSWAREAANAAQAADALVEQRRKRIAARGGWEY